MRTGRDCATVCYMSVGAERVGIRELRQNLSVYLRRVVKGEVLEVTDRGRPVALLVPVPASERPVEQLVATGRAWPPRGSVMDVLPPKGEPTTRLSRALEEERAERL